MLRIFLDRVPTTATKCSIIFKYLINLIHKRSLSFPDRKQFRVPLLIFYHSQFVRIFRWPIIAFPLGIPTKSKSNLPYHHIYPHHIPIECSLNIIISVFYVHYISMTFLLYMYIIFTRTWFPGGSS